MLASFYICISTHTFLYTFSLFCSVRVDYTHTRRTRTHTRDLFRIYSTISSRKLEQELLFSQRDESHCRSSYLQDDVLLFQNDDDILTRWILRPGMLPPRNLGTKVLGIPK